MTPEELTAAFDRWTEAVKAAQLDPFAQHELNLHVASGLRQLPDLAANKAGMPPLLEGVAADLELLQ